ncbi:gamma-glutamylcyclotransferase [Amycolatopsis sp. NBC_01480]|uniref:gamma-glutamylcyclotransferase n=1 Tax=Amycolatopsis sp. NBC_01480 TaxID=2903562 RepID=UPI002E2E6F92|nr:gamma-glutamylcyclotransferase [Amycolatopsis sp. NBC_01480]
MTAPPGWRERTPVLAYGSNACPSKITWLREHLGLTGPVVVLKARSTGLAAVWAAGLRKRDGQRPATLAAMPGVVEEHAVWFATPDQLAVLDVCEGRGNRYDLARLTAADIRLEDGTRLDGVHAYVANSDIRRPLLVDGRPVRVAEVGQARAAALTGVPAPGHGVPCEVLTPTQTFS